MSMKRLSSMKLRPLKRQKGNKKIAQAPPRMVEEYGDPVPPEALQWKPLMEGEDFLGIEEIDDVDVAYETLAEGRIKKPIFKPVNKAMVKKDSHATTTPANPQEKKKLDKKRSKRNEKKKQERRNKYLKPDVEPEEGNVFAALESLPAIEQTQDELPLWSEAKINLSEALTAGLSKLKFNEPTEIQRLSIPLILEDKDVIGKASTGSGKTLAFGIPILEKYLSNPDQKNPVALILTPTRELTNQICQHLRQVSLATAASIVSVTGGMAIQKQERLLLQNPTIIVANPGRLHQILTESDPDIVNKIKSVSFLVLDEADRLLQEGHYAELQDILNILPDPSESHRQTLVFSATFNKDLVKKLSFGGTKKFSKDASKIDDSMADLFKHLKFKDNHPSFVDCNPDESVSKLVTECMIECEPLEKDLYLYYFLLKYPGRTLVFANSIDAVKRLVPLLRELHLPATGIHSGMMQKQRLRSIERFTQDSNAILVATDVAARGLDIQHIKHVIHYHLPRSADMYVHRSGRTARREEGVSVVICCPQEKSNLLKMVVKLNKSLKDIKNIQTLDRRISGMLKPRVTLAKRLADSSLIPLTNSQGSTGSSKALMREAADDLGVDYVSSSEDDTSSTKKKSRKGSNKLSKPEEQSIRDELEELLSKPVNTGFSARYLTSGSVNLAHRLLNESDHGAFLGIDQESALDAFSKLNRAKK